MENAESSEDNKKYNSNAKKHTDKVNEIDEHISNRYDIKKRLGKGAYGIVYKAVNKKTNEVVAIKKIFDAFRNQTDAQRTYREIFFLKSFRKHPNIIKLNSIHRAFNNKDIYLTFEYMQTDLHNVIRCGNILKDIHKRYIMYQILKATKYIHSGNVIHRDQKPSNVLIDNACRVKIADFGLARSLSTQDKNGHSGADPCLTDYVATRWYRAPEILIASKTYTKGIDMWSLGCILGEMINGKPIFPGSSTVNQVEKIMSSLPIPSDADISAVCTGYGSSLMRTSVKKRTTLRELLPDASEDALDLISRLIVFNPMKRCSASQALEHIYVSKFNHDTNELVLTEDVIPPLRENLRLSVDEYRNKIYGLTKKDVPRVMQASRESIINNTKKITVVSSVSNVLSPPHEVKNADKKNFYVSNKTILQKPSINTREDMKVGSKCKIEVKSCNSMFDTHKKYIPNGAIQNKEKKRNPLFKNNSMEEENEKYRECNHLKCRNDMIKLKTDGIYQRNHSRKTII